MSWRAAGVVALGLVLLCRSTAAHAEAANAQIGSGEAPKESAANLDEPVVRVGSEVIRRRDLGPPPELDLSPESGNVWWWSSQEEAAFELVLEKSLIAFCRQADCAPDPKDVASWNALMQVMRSEQDPQTATGYELFDRDEPADWQAKKALYKRYGGRVTSGDFGGSQPEPIEAQLRLVEDLEKRGELEFYDPQVRADVMEYFKRYLQESFEVDESFRYREGKRDPWERPWWQMAAEEAMRQKEEAMRQKLDALQTKQ